MSTPWVNKQSDKQIFSKHQEIYVRKCCYNTNRISFNCIIHLKSVCVECVRVGGVWWQCSQYLQYTEKCTMIKKWWKTFNYTKWRFNLFLSNPSTIEQEFYWHLMSQWSNDITQREAQPCTEHGEETRFEIIIRNQNRKNLSVLKTSKSLQS